MIALNERAWRLADELVADAKRLNVAVSHAAGGTRVIDCGVEAAGGLEAGWRLAEICMAGLGRVQLTAASSALPKWTPGGESASNAEPGPSRREGPTVGEWSGPLVTIETDQPLLACMASQYAGWQIAEGKFFAMGSGPMRAVACREPLFEQIGVRETADRVVGVLESSKLPGADVCEKIAGQCGVVPSRVTLLVARTASIAGTVQVVARSVETALHKLHELGYDLSHVASGFGSAPLPPVAADDLIGIGRTNDAILYGGQVALWVRNDDAALAEIGPQVPSCASRDFGEPFASIFERYGRDFYQIDPLLFSPAVVTLVNLSTGRSHRFGDVRPDVLERSFHSE